MCMMIETVPYLVPPNAHKAFSGVQETVWDCFLDTFRTAGAAIVTNQYLFCI